MHICWPGLFLLAAIVAPWSFSFPVSVLWTKTCNCFTIHGGYLRGMLFFSFAEMLIADSITYIFWYRCSFFYDCSCCRGDCGLWGVLQEILQRQRIHPRIHLRRTTACQALFQIAKFREVNHGCIAPTMYQQRSSKVYAVIALAFLWATVNSYSMGGHPQVMASQYMAAFGSPTHWTSYVFSFDFQIWIYYIFWNKSPIYVLFTYLYSSLWRGLWKNTPFE